jgi:hypothetical protein
VPAADWVVGDTATSCLRYKREHATIGLSLLGSLPNPLHHGDGFVFPWRALWATLAPRGEHDEILI